MTPCAQVCAEPADVAEARDDLLHRRSAEAAGDVVRIRAKLAGTRIGVPLVEQGIDRPGVDQRRLDLLETGSFNAMRHEPERIGVRRPDRSSGQTEIHADLVGHPRQRVRRADVGKKADRRFRHGELVGRARHAMRAIERDADAGTHHRAVDQ